MYRHQARDGSVIPLPIGKVVCVGRSYLDHAQEMNASVPEQPLLFLKPSTALVSVQEDVSIPTQWGECHNELEVAVLIKQPMTKVLPADVMAGCWGMGLGLDLTLRDVQAQLKREGFPWERAKAFDGSCPMSPFIPLSEIATPDHLSFSLHINGQLRQQGNTSMLCWDIATLIAAMSDVFTLLPGDIIMTGTPKGVGPLHQGDVLTLALADHYQATTKVIAR